MINKKQNLKSSINNIIYITIITLILNTTAQGNPQELPATPFSYAYQTEVAINDKPGVELPAKVEQLAKACFGYLNLSLFFNVNFILNANNVRTEQKKRLNTTFFTATTVDGQTLSCTYIDRKSNNILIVGPGFTNNRELMAPFVAMFDSYDVVLFDYRGHGYNNDAQWLAPSTWELSLSKYLFGVNAKKTTLGAKEDLDVLAVIEKVKSMKPNSKIHGLGVCFSTFIFLKVAAQYPGAFDKLILDGSWTIFKEILDKLKKDPKLICTPQNGGWKNHYLFKRSFVQRMFEPLAYWLMGFRLPDLSIFDVLKQGQEALKNTPILFFQGKNDLLIARSEFEDLWNALPCSSKATILTSNPHVRNHWKQKELYKLIGEAFIELPFQTFSEILFNIPALTTYLIEKNNQKITQEIA